MTRDFLSVLQTVLDETGIEPHRLELEVTEMAMMQDRDRAAFILDSIAEMAFPLPSTILAPATRTYPI